MDATLKSSATRGEVAEAASWARAAWAGRREARMETEGGGGAEAEADSAAEEEFPSEVASPSEFPALSPSRARTRET